MEIIVGEWPNRARKVLALHNVRVSENGLAITSSVGWSIRDTARELGVSHTYAWKLIRIAKLLESDPDLSKLSWKKISRIAGSRQTTEELDNV